MYWSHVRARAAGSYQSRSLANLPSFSDAQKSVEVILQTFLLLWAFENRALWWWIFVACPRLLQPQVSAFSLYRLFVFCLFIIFANRERVFMIFHLSLPGRLQNSRLEASRKRVFSMKWSSITFAASRINHGNTKMSTWKSKISCIATYWVDPTRCLRIFCIPSHNIFEL